LAEQSDFDLAKQPGTQHWSLQPVVSRKIPSVKSTSWPRNEIDFFVLTKLDAAGLSPSPESGRATLIRRLNFDLIGLPPTPEEIDAFEKDPSPKAYERVVERLLASPHYGERWARHWLDVVRYTESQGFEYDHMRPNAWHYRDYVIASFNADKPYDQFVKEQIAGDAMEPVTAEKIVATSLLVCGSWDQAGNSQANATQRALTREEELEDLVSVVAQTFLGLTVNCARCHDHKFDPVPQEDYYRIKSVFEGVRHGERVVATKEEIQRHEDKVGALQSRIAETENRVRQLDALGRQRVLKEAEVAAFLAASGLDVLPEEILGALKDEERSGRKTCLRQIAADRAALKKIPPLPVSYAGVRKQPEPTRLLKRGDANAPGETMKPGALSAISKPESDFDLPADAPEAERRLKLAHWMADPRNPLTARVIINRLWHYHFGAGIVATPNDLGATGAKPSHPELLDWLAATLIEHGWSLKALHWLIVSSATYRQASTFNPEAARIDADNQLLWRFSPRRLEAEVLRDAMLAVAGQINLAQGGISFRPFDTKSFNATFYFPADKIGPEFNRRTVYRMNINSGKDPLLDSFDCPDPATKTPRRGTTTTPLQALSLMNSPFVQRQASHLAERVSNEAHGRNPETIRRAYRYALGRYPTREEAAGAETAAAETSLENLCWALLNATEFVYVR
jgi:hypothetical protein